MVREARHRSRERYRVKVMKGIEVKFLMAS